MNREHIKKEAQLLSHVATLIAEGRIEITKNQLDTIKRLNDELVRKYRVEQQEHDDR